MKTILRTLFWGCFFLFSMTQCTLCSGPCLKSPLPPEASQYFDFDKGSYWIYRNTQNGAIDSFFVSNRRREAATNTYKEDGINCRDEQIVLLINSSESEFEKAGVLNQFISSQNGKTNNILTLNSFFSSPINYKAVSEVNIGNKLYQDVLMLDNCCLSNNCGLNNDFCNTQYKYPFTFTKLMYAPNIGLIHWEMNNHPIYGKVIYELIRYKIVNPPKI